MQLAMRTAQLNQSPCRWIRLDSRAAAAAVVVAVVDVRRCVFLHGCRWRLRRRFGELTAGVDHRDRPEIRRVHRAARSAKDRAHPARSVTREAGRFVACWVARSDPSRSSRSCACEVVEVDDSNETTSEPPAMRRMGQTWERDETRRDSSKMYSNEFDSIRLNELSSVRFRLVPAAIADHSLTPTDDRHTTHL